MALSYDGFIRFRDESGAPGLIGFDHGSNAMQFYTNGSTEAMRITSGGDMGLGTVSPTSLTGSWVLTINHGTHGGAIEFTKNGTSFGRALLQGSSSVILETRQDIPLLFGTGTGSAERMRIRSDGKVLIGTTDTQDSNSLLQVYKSSGTSTVWNESDSLSNGQYSMFRNSWRSSGTSNSGRAWIGVHKHSGITNACGFIFMDAQNSNNNYYWTDDASNLRRTSSASNIGTTNGTVVGTQTSDERVKNVGDSVSLRTC